MRLDKYLKVSRLIKRRTVANDACDVARITVNGKPLSETQTYLVATNDFMSVGGDDYTMLNKPVVNEFCALDEAVFNYLNDSGSEALEQAEGAVRLAAA